ncbi:8-oxoguanine DNA glycosylase [Aneurinibacillus danicus]|jgi:thermostable 8-oxoguanine DNA glycosylase|uniref:8-oxoguanine DNA glycosylase n=1 Tax=Aneurinibacillus danicus TaxID=267746 RepID=A0A511V805_9BACL|nr:hypothetical protein [Aneurinibacillus danicus]GEN35075.1 hypothetical protein ADA01nite_25350 [Aneurinibacillus danicus]
MNTGIKKLISIWTTYSLHTNKRKNKSLTPEQMHNELFFCLLGGYGIPYELNQSAFEILQQKGLFQLKYYQTFENQMINILERELMMSQFAPRTRQGTFRKYRYPKTKARTIFKAAQWLLHDNQRNLPAILRAIPEEKARRAKIMECPGMGMKSASWFLRNTGYATSLAIVDVHIFRFLTFYRFIPQTYSPSRNYEEIEDVFKRICHVANVPVDEGDLALWEWMHRNYRIL